MAGANAGLSIRFFKIILQTNLQRIKIPSMFTRRHGFGLSNPIFLKPPDGTKWKVFWKKQNNGEVWLEIGWKEFTQNYSLQYGCMVMFKYEGEGTSSQFDVIILDKSAVEIDYPSCKSPDIFYENNKARQSSTLVSPRPHKKFRGESKIENEKAKERTSSLNWIRGDKVQEVADSNLIFTITLKPDNLDEDRLDLPHEFGLFVRQQKYQKVILIGPRVGHATCKVLIEDGQKRATKLQQGWKQFCRMNNLLPGHKLSFEFEDSPEDNIALVKIVPS